MKLQKAFLLLTVLTVLSACAAPSVWAPDDAVTRAAYAPPPPPTVTLLTAISNGSGAGGHSSLMIDGAQRLMFDPAGSWHHPNVPERNDVLYGMTPQLYGFYMDYHARETYHMVVQEIQVSPETAARLSQAVQQYGSVSAARCALSISRVLSQTPGFESIGVTWSPRRIMNRFEDLPGVRTSRVYDDDSDDNLELLQAQARAERYGLPEEFTN
ncbi:hypothetical protein E2K80_17175 [Rhodophyticola sp. CCM32]|uniref:hypothetical protein n=1 Tax=Rhodophyticola sp. CCM32 TaxID=2916397 RepID=UPI00107FAC37|nr:hypothetical protein [Rhodophyticola sp. CCM32]QBY02256.1 hypothetical protein E2K80_17175 [Rhodophyticola sp. CCM32]